MSPTNILSGVRAVICDVYGTLLEVGLPPEDAESRWHSLCLELGLTPRTLEGFNAGCNTRIASENAAARAAGEPWPDQDWLAIACLEWPELHSLETKDIVELCWRYPGC